MMTHKTRGFSAIIAESQALLKSLERSKKCTQRSVARAKANADRLVATIESLD